LKFKAPWKSEFATAMCEFATVDKLSKTQQDAIFLAAARTYEQLWREQDPEYFSHDGAKFDAFLLEPRTFAPDAQRKWQELFGNLDEKKIDSGGITLWRDGRSYQFISDTPKIWREFSRSLVDDVDCERSEIAEMGMGKGITKRYKITRKNGVESVEAVN